MLQVLHGAIGIGFLLVVLLELTSGSRRRPVRIHWMAIATASVTCVLNLLSSVGYELHGSALLWTVGTLIAYLGFLTMEARLWTLDAGCACFGSGSGSIRTAMYRNAILIVVLVGIALMQWDRTVVLLAPVAVVGLSAGLMSATALGPTRRLVVRGEVNTADGKAAQAVRLLALDSRCITCVRLARRIARTRLPQGVDGILTDHAMRIVFQATVRLYHPAHAMTLTWLPTPCLVDIRHDGAVLSIDGIGTLDVRRSHSTT